MTNKHSITVPIARAGFLLLLSLDYIQPGFNHLLNSTTQISM